MIEMQRIIGVEDIEVGQNFPCTKVISSTETSETIKCGDEMLQKTALCKDCHAVYKEGKANAAKDSSANGCAALWQRMTNYAKQHPKLAIGVGVGVGLSLVAAIVGASVPSAASASGLASALNSTLPSNTNSSSSASTPAASTKAPTQASSKAPTPVSSNTSTEAPSKASTPVSSKTSTKAPSKASTPVLSKTSTKAPAANVTPTPYSKCENGQLFLMNIKGDRGEDPVEAIQIDKTDSSESSVNVFRKAYEQNAQANQTCHFSLSDNLYPSNDTKVIFMNRGSLVTTSSLTFSPGQGAIAINSTRYDNSTIQFNESCDIPAGFGEKCEGIYLETKGLEYSVGYGFLHKDKLHA